MFGFLHRAEIIVRCPDFRSGIGEKAGRQGRSKYSFQVLPEIGKLGLCLVFACHQIINDVREIKQKRIVWENRTNWVAQREFH